MEASHSVPDPFEVSAKREWQVWLAVVGGLAIVAFAIAASASDGCDRSGNCSPVISAVTQLAGFTFVAYGLSALWRNGSRGSRFDTETGELVWWQDRTPTSPGDGGCIHPTRISRIVTVNYDDSANGIHAFDETGERLAHFDEKVLPWRSDLWIEQLVRAYPHILVERR